MMTIMMMMMMMTMMTMMSMMSMMMILRRRRTGFIITTASKGEKLQWAYKNKGH